MTESLTDLNETLRGLNTLQRVGLKINMGKTKAMFDAHVVPMQVHVGTDIIIVVDYCVIGSGASARFVQLQN